MSSQNDSLNNYGMVAAEYYDAGRHPTSAAFRAASVRLLTPLLIQGTQGKVLEIGSGRSVAAEILSDQGSSLLLVISDSEPSMLAHSRSFAGERTVLTVTSATCLSFPDQTFALVVASLGDPYNLDSFWTEASRVLEQGGRLLFTTPTHNWSTKFRVGGSAADKTAAEFELHNGMIVNVPSNVLEVGAQREMIAAHGLELEDVHEVTRDQVPLASVAPKLDVADDGPVVSLYVVRKPFGTAH